MAAADIRDALERIGFTAESAMFIVVTQGYNSLEELGVLTDKEVASLCKVVRRPGGTMVNPQAVVVGQPAAIPNPGLSVSLRAENNLKLACYFIRYRGRTSRTCDPSDITLANVRSLRGHKEWEEQHEDLEAPEINPRDWPRTIDSLEEWLRGNLGLTKIPLMYVVRDEIEVKPSADDPEANYDTKQDELISRAPIHDATGVPTATYLADRGRVWDLLSEITRNKECWSYVRPAQRKRDGRKAYLGLKMHYLGKNNVDNMSSRAEHKLQNTSYTGEKRRWNFEKYVTVHVNQHAILEGLKQHGYAGIDERSKVRHLLAGIKTNALDSVKTRIYSDEKLRQDFEACVNLFQDFIEQQGGSKVVDRYVAAIEALKHKQRGSIIPDEMQPDLSIEDRYYTADEYRKLTAKQRLGLRIKREKRGHKSRPGKNKDKDKKRKLDISKRSIKAIASALQSCDIQDQDEEKKKDDSETETESEEQSPKRMKEMKNRNNKALSRKGKQ